MFDICNAHSFVLVQEHWLYNNQLDKFSGIPGICFHAISGMPSNILLTGRPYGGFMVELSQCSLHLVESVVLLLKLMI